MNFIYCHITNEFDMFNSDSYTSNLLPDYFFMSVKQIKFFNPNAYIYLICNTNNISKEQNLILNDLHVNIINSIQLLHNKNINDLINEYRLCYYDKNLALFNFTGICRYFLIENFVKQENLIDIIQIESDNLVYIDFDKNRNLFKEKCLMNKVNDERLCCGISYYYNYNVMHDINENILNIMKNVKLKYMNDMFILSYIYNNTNLIHILNSHINDTKLIFDPCSYGQYIAGTNNGHSPGFIDMSHDIGKYIIEKKLKFSMQNKKIYVNDNLLAVIHVHNKHAIKNLISYE